MLRVLTSLAGKRSLSFAGGSRWACISPRPARRGYAAFLGCLRSRSLETPQSRLPQQTLDLPVAAKRQHQPESLKAVRKSGAWRARRVVGRFVWKGLLEVGAHFRRRKGALVIPAPSGKPSSGPSQPLGPHPPCSPHWACPRDRVPAASLCFPQQMLVNDLNTLLSV